MEQLKLDVDFTDPSTHLGEPIELDHPATTCYMSEEMKKRQAEAQLEELQQREEMTVKWVV